MSVWRWDLQIPCFALQPLLWNKDLSHQRRILSDLNCCYVLNTLADHVWSIDSHDWEGLNMRNFLHGHSITAQLFVVVNAQGSCNHVWNPLHQIHNQRFLKWNVAHQMFVCASTCKKLASWYFTLIERTLRAMLHIFMHLAFSKISLAASSVCPRARDNMAATFGFEAGAAEVSDVSAESFSAMSELTGDASRWNVAHILHSSRTSVSFRSGCGAKVHFWGLSMDSM